MSNDLAVIMAGFDRIEAHVLDSSGVIAGLGNLLPGQSSNGFRLLAVKNAPNIGVPNADTTAITGDDDYQGGFGFPSQQVRQTVAEFAVEALDVNGYLGGGSPYAIGNSEVGFLDASPFAPSNLAIIANGQAKSAQGANLGLGLFTGMIFPQIQGIPLGRQNMQERAAGNNRIQLIASKAAQFPWGETFQQAVHTIITAVQVPFIANNRKAMWAARGDGVTTVFPTDLLYTPASSSLSDVVVYKNGYKMTTGVTVSVANKRLTFSPAPANNDKLACYYDHI